jgi:membrane-associated protease RseP (regulator of RpoE activity)
MNWMKAEILAASLVIGCGSTSGNSQQPNQPAQQGQYQAPAATWGDGVYPPPAANDNNQTQAPPQAQNDNGQQPPQHPMQQQPGQQPQPPPSAEGSNQYANPGGDEDTAVESYQWVQGQSRLGIVVMGLTRDLRQYFNVPRDRGVLVAHVMPHSSAAHAGIRAGDVVIEIAGQPVRSADDVLTTLAEQPKDRQFSIGVVRQSQPLQLQAMLMPQHHAREHGHEQDRPASAL